MCVLLSLGLNVKSPWLLSEVLDSISNYLRDTFLPRAINLEKKGFQIELHVVMVRCLTNSGAVGSMESFDFCDSLR